ncbi:tRNA (cytidine/uridine-2'-O-)-methyltransferase [Alicyclobacillus sacchari]|uniref:Putative tRNA (cytidine(34)-2'-O)-methyltransferase n=1 Tax=Alicyclobacillus sacchari TaxID=392010 RepID=A0A4R8LK76_9BACL|nr:tRNA (uridine(34)/cytosine(34)/5-carboxymethylaminomethyluridine(34)-2'-O)-methyltransferase TrmL [Alicyclobacillus sacchari]TDY44551.1 tRNA (cytidine/uridine-2'-O-)-methyltransferase [Alicyclobacillus sacchari]
MHIVLVEPEIPANTGNIARTCAVTGSTLHLIRPLGFSTDDRQLKRAGLDYWHLLDIRYHDSIDHLWAQFPTARFHYVETQGGRWYTDVTYTKEDFLVFGKETKGLPKDVLAANQDHVIRIPMLPDGAARSLNLSNAVAVVVFEALRQTGFTGMV